MATQRPTRRVRRAPLMTRIKSYLDPWDFLLWISEELNTNDDEWMETLNEWAIPFGVLLNVVYMAARANSSGAARPGDDVFEDYYESRASGWLGWIASLVANSLVLLSFANAFFTFNRRRHYRLFEKSVDAVPNTTSARRVRVDSSPMSSSPLQYLSNAITSATAAGRSHPDPSRDVWELAVWDPKPVALRIFCLFSPGHVLLYRMFLPVAPLDPRPSVTVATTIALAALLSGQLMVMQTFFSQQAKDSTLVHKEVQNEYDKKFVHPSLNKPVRDVATQTRTRGTPQQVAEVSTFTPTTYVNRGFQTNPNPNYSPHYDPDGLSLSVAGGQEVRRSVTTPDLRAPTGNTPAGFSSPLRTPSTATHYPQIRHDSSAAQTGDGGSFGIYSHPRSPLKRTSFYPTGLPNERIRERSPAKRESSPLKMSSTPDMNGKVHMPGANTRLPRNRRRS